jgi:hypothetical protein
MKRFFLVCMMLSGCSMLVEESPEYVSDTTSDTESASETDTGYSTEETDSGQIDTGSVQETDTGSETVTQTTEVQTDSGSVQETDTGSETVPVAVCDPKDPCCNLDGTLKPKGTVCFSDLLGKKCGTPGGYCNGVVLAQFNEAVCDGAVSYCIYGSLAPSEWRVFLDCSEGGSCESGFGEVKCQAGCYYE